MIRVVLMSLLLVGCNGFGPTHRYDPPISALMICDYKPLPKGCDR
jgi:hypothetical protein